MDAFTPAQASLYISELHRLHLTCFAPPDYRARLAHRRQKARMRIDKMFINSFMGGCLISFGCALSLSTSTSPWFQTNAPGLIRTISAMVFPVGLIMVVLTGADLFTSYCMYSVVALLHRRCSFLDLLKTWVVSFFGNLAGALFFMAVLTGYGGTFEAGAYKDEALAFAKGKAVTPEWHQIFLKAILCNWLVCMAVFLAISSREVLSKIVAMWFPVMCFVGLGTDHVVANMYFIPLAIFLGAPKPLTVSYYIWKSMIPSLLGNIIGGGVFCGGVYWYLFLAHETVPIHFDTVDANTAVYEQGGPIQRQATVDGAGTGYGIEHNKNVVPNSGNNGRSGIAKELDLGLVESLGRKREGSERSSGSV